MIFLALLFLFIQKYLTVTSMTPQEALMSVSLTFACGLTTTLLSAFAVVRYLNTPLRRQLQELCGNAERAEFWAAFSNVTVVLTPAIFAMPVEPSSGDPPLLAVISQLRWGFIGLVASVVMLGWILGRFIRRTSTARTDFPAVQKASAES
jgi:hypothetical protein